MVFSGHHLLLLLLQDGVGGGAAAAAAAAATLHMKAFLNQLLIFMTKLTHFFSWFNAIKQLTHNWHCDALQSTCHLWLAFTYDLLNGHNVYDSISGHYDDGYLDLIHAPLKASSLRAKRAFAAWIRCGVICQFTLIREVILASYAATSWSSCCARKANVCNEMWNTTLAI